MSGSARFTPQNFQNPYPDKVVKIGCVKYVSHLHICRARNALTRGSDKKDPEYVVCKDYKVKYSTIDGNGESRWFCLLIPAGTLTDFSSVPFLFRCFVERVGRHLEASIIHDFLYVAWQHINGRGPQPMDRKFSDDIFLAAMRAAQVPFCRRNAMYIATKSCFGRKVYEKENYINFVDPSLFKGCSCCNSDNDSDTCSRCASDNESNECCHHDPGLKDN